MSTRRTNVRGIIYSDGQLLVTKFRQEDNSESERWGAFGGGLDIGESILEGLHREMIEETGIAPKIGRLLFIQQFYDGEKNSSSFSFTSKTQRTTKRLALRVLRTDFSNSRAVNS